MTILIKTLAALLFTVAIVILSDPKHTLFEIMVAGACIAYAIETILYLAKENANNPK